jgi:hypothetical protein
MVIQRATADDVGKFVEKLELQIQNHKQELQQAIKAVRAQKLAELTHEKKQLREARRLLKVLQKMEQARPDVTAGDIFWRRRKQG